MLAKTLSVCEVLGICGKVSAVLGRARKIGSEKRSRHRKPKRHVWAARS